MRRAYHYLCRGEALVAGTLLVLMVLLILLGGLARLAHMPLVWTTDLATCFFAWACFLAADIAWRKNSLMAVEVVTDRLPERLQSAFRFLNYGLIVAFLLYLIVMGLHLSWVSRIRSFQGIPGVSYSWVTMSLPVGAALLLLTTVRKILEEIRGEHERSRALDVV